MSHEDAQITIAILSLVFMIGARLVDWYFFGYKDRSRNNNKDEKK